MQIGDMKSNGFILLHRKMLETSFYQKPRAVLLAIHILLKACHKDTPLAFEQNLYLRRGQYLGGFKRLSAELGWTKTQVRRAMYVLEEAHFLTRNATSKYCIITIVNYNSYQGCQKYPEAGPPEFEGVKNDTQGVEMLPPSGSPVTPQGVPNVPPGCRNVTPYNNINNEQINNIYSASFEELWTQYPSKVGKKEALRHFNASVKTDEDLESIKTALNVYKNSKRVAQGYAMNGSTWFNNWRDWVVDPEQGPDADLEKMKELVKEGK